MSDIEKKIATAYQDQKLKKERAHLHTQPDKSPIRQKVPKIIWIATLFILAVAIFTIVRPYLPVSDAVVRKELKDSLDAAQASVEEYRRANGKLPDRVPDPTLSGLVRYEATGDEYRLSLTMNGETLAREQ